MLAKFSGWANSVKLNRLNFKTMKQTENRGEGRGKETSFERACKYMPIATSLNQLAAPLPPDP